MSLRILSQSLMLIVHSVSVILKLSPTQGHMEFHSSFSFSRSALKSRGAAFSTVGSTSLLLHLWLDLGMCPYLKN